jgi:hypothetical protein
VDDYVIIASTRALAESLAQLAAAPPSAAMVATNALLRLDGPAVLAALRDNRAMLIAQTMIRQSSDRSQAEAEVDLLLDLLTRLETFEVELKSEAQNLRLDIAFSVRDAQ